MVSSATIVDDLRELAKPVHPEEPENKLLLEAADLILQLQQDVIEIQKRYKSRENSIKFKLIREIMNDLNKKAGELECDEFL